MKYWIAAVISCTATYLAYAFIAMSLQPIDWGMDMRVLCVFTFVVVFGIASAITADVR